MIVRADPAAAADARGAHRLLQAMDEADGRRKRATMAALAQALMAKRCTAIEAATGYSRAIRARLGVADAGSAPERDRFGTADAARAPEAGRGETTGRPSGGREKRQGEGVDALAGDTSTAGSRPQ